MTLLKTDRLVLRNWSDDDQAVLHRLYSDEAIMKYFPFRKSRAESDAILTKFRNGITDRGYGWSVVALRKGCKAIGFTGLSNFQEDLAFCPVTEIGWRFLPEVWGNGYATEAASAWLEYGFNKIGLEKIVSFAVPENTGSTAVMTRIGMTHYPELDFDHPGVSDDYPHLKRHAYYDITSLEFSTRQTTTQS